MSALPVDFHPEFAALTEQNALLRAELAQLLTREDELLRNEKPHLLGLYQTKLGAWEVSCLEAQIEAARARRRLEMAQAAINQNRAPDWKEIDGHLELEFLAWQQRLREATERLSAAGERLKHLLPPEKAVELRKLYYALVKKLHPDVNLAPDENQRRLWQRVQDAYEKQDMEELRALALMAQEPEPPAPSPHALDLLRQDRDALQKRIAEMERRIEQIESQSPFPLREQLVDEAWVSAKRGEIEGRIAQFEKQRAALDAALQTLIKTPDDGTKFSPN